MASHPFTQPIRRDLCWVCDRRLYAGGRSYHLVEIDGVERPVHQACLSQVGR